MFVDGPEFFLVLAQLNNEGDILTKFQENILPVVLEETRQQEMFTDGQLDERRRVPTP